jgi:hypothetical protein
VGATIVVSIVNWILHALLDSITGGENRTTVVRIGR